MFANKVVAMTLNKNILTGSALLILSLTTLAACSSTTQTTTINNASEINDPFEEQNRHVFAFNQGVDKVIVNPVVKGYQIVVPEPARTGVDNALKNLRSPTNFANEVLQGDFEGAGNVLLRAIINTFIGLGGLFDVAGHEGIEYESEDFGQTLAKWGVENGPYIVAPFIGPSTARDYVGFFVDSYTDPLRWYAFNVEREGLFYGKVGIEYLNLRSNLIDVLEELENSSIDYYAATRSAYYQRREALINDQASDLTTQSADIPDYDD